MLEVCTVRILQLRIPDERQWRPFSLPILWIGCKCSAIQQFFFQKLHLTIQDLTKKRWRRGGKQRRVEKIFKERFILHICHNPSSQLRCLQVGHYASKVLSPIILQEVLFFKTFDPESFWNKNLLSAISTEGFSYYCVTAHTNQKHEGHKLQAS